MVFNPATVIFYLWIVLQPITLGYCINLWVAVSFFQSSDSAFEESYTNAISLQYVWFSLILIGFSIGSALFMLNQISNTQLGYGFICGSLIILSMDSLIYAVINSALSGSTFVSLTVFSILFFILSIFMFGLMVYYSGIIISGEEKNSDGSPA